MMAVSIPSTVRVMMISEFGSRGAAPPASTQAATVYMVIAVSVPSALMVTMSMSPAPSPLPPPSTISYPPFGASQMMLSLPPSPKITSLPPRPLITSAPPAAKITSVPGEPVMLSAAGVPLMMPLLGGVTRRSTSWSAKRRISILVRRSWPSPSIGLGRPLIGSIGFGPAVTLIWVTETLPSGLLRML